MVALPRRSLREQPGQHGVEQIERTADVDVEVLASEFGGQRPGPTAGGGKVPACVNDEVRAARAARSCRRLPERTGIEHISARAFAARVLAHEGLQQGSLPR